jgi:cytochrome P450
MVFGAVMTRIREEVAARAHEPRDDAMTAISYHEIDGERIPRDVAESIVFMTVGGGVDTTTALYYKEAMDITKDAIAAYDKAYPPK